MGQLREFLKVTVNHKVYEPAVVWGDLACVASEISMGAVLYCFGGGAARREGIQVNFPRGFAASRLAKIPPVAAEEKYLGHKNPSSYAG